MQFDPQAAKPFLRFSRRPSVRVRACIKDKSAFLFPVLQKDIIMGILIKAAYVLLDLLCSFL